MSELIKQERFMNNHLIDKLKDEPYWTVSDEKKRPLDAKRLMQETDQFALASFQNDNWPMLPLTVINEDKRLLCTNRAYRLHATDNRVICIDMEKTASDELRKSLSEFPVHYAETSLSGTGIHYLIQIPEELIPEDTKYLFDEMVVVKSEDGSFEVFFNDHFVTLTKRQLKPSEYTLARFNEEPIHRQKITKMLTMLAEIQKARVNASKAAAEFMPEATYDELTPYEQYLVSSTLKRMHPKSKHMQNNPFKTLSDFENDHSRYELYLATSLAQRIITMHKENIAATKYDKKIMRKYGLNKGDVKRFIEEYPEYEDFDINTEETREHLAGMVYNILCSDEIRDMEILTQRNKHRETRNEMPWLMDRAVRGTGFACKTHIQTKNENTKDKESDTQSSKGIAEYMKNRLGAEKKKE